MTEVNNIELKINDSPFFKGILLFLHQKEKPPENFAILHIWT